MNWQYFTWIILIIVCAFLIFFYWVAPSIRLMYDGDCLESFDNPLEVKKDMIDKDYARIYDKVFDEKEMYVVEAKSILDFMGEKRVKGVVLDVGTGTGKHYQHMSVGGNKVLGLERSGAMIDIFRMRNPLGKVIEGDMRNEGLFEAQKFGMIVCLKETLYHNKVKDWDSILSNFYYWLKPNGYLVLHIFDRDKLDPAPRNMTFVRKDGEGRRHGITNFPNFTHDGWWETKGKVVCQYNEIIAVRDKKGNIIRKKHYKHNLAIPEKEKIMEKVLGNYFKLMNVVKMEKIGIVDHELCFFKKIK